MEGRTCQRPWIIDPWAADQDFWIRRSALLALLPGIRSGAPDLARLTWYAEPMLTETEFFIRKAIGWVLREISRRDPRFTAEWTMPIVADTKDWTWVLRRPCPECGLDTASLARESIPGMILANAAAWPPALAAADVARRPRPDKWSPLEYACHVRDVFRLYDYRLGLMLSQDDPLFPNWDQDETAVADRYAEQDPAEVGPQVTASAAALASRFASVSGDQWLRTGRRSDGAEFTVETFGRYLIHDPVHHLYDVTGVRVTSAS